MASKRKEEREPVVFKSVADSTGPRVVSTGLPGLDDLLGGGLLEFGSRVLVSGHTGTGKTALLLYLAKRMHWVTGAPVVFIDAELKPGIFLRAKKAVGNADWMYVVQESNANNIQAAIEQALDEIGARVFVIDSMSAVTTALSEEALAEDATVSVDARAVGRMIRALGGRLLRAQATLLMSATLYSSIGGYGRYTGPSFAVKGGRQLLYSANVHLRLTKAGSDGATILTKAKLVKVSSALREARLNEEWAFAVRSGQVLEAYDILEQGLEQGLVERSGAWYTLQAGVDPETGEVKTVKVQGRNAAYEAVEAIEYLRERMCGEQQA